MVTNIRGSFGLSKYWTYQDVVSEILVLTNTADNEKIQLSNVRTHVRTAMSYIVNLLNLAEAPYYNIFMNLEFDDLHPTGLGVVDLNNDIDISTLMINPPPNPVYFNPAVDTNQIKRINIFPIGGKGVLNQIVADAQGTSTVTAINTTQLVEMLTAEPFKGNVIKKDLSELFQLSTNQNTQWYHSIVWTHSGNELLFMYGKEVLDFKAKIIEGGSKVRYYTNINNNPTNIVADSATDPLGNVTMEKTHYMNAVATRKPLLDDMLPPEISNTYKYFIDLPDEYIDLVVKMGQKKTLEQLNLTVPGQLDAEINQGLLTINNMLQQDLQLEMAEREKRKYGQQQRPPGAV